MSAVFRPRRAASWWTHLEDLQWPEKKIVDRIKRRAEAFAAAEIDTAINFGFHIRFDFANYFGYLHRYFSNVCEELHRYNIRFLDHYSCNHVERPRGPEGLKRLQKTQRHHVLLFHDAGSAEIAQYEGHFFNDCCEIDLRDGARGFSSEYQLEVFCHNNPAFLDMHRKYLVRLLKEVPMDGIQVDDMCDYAGLTTCGCRYCRDRFRKDYGQEIPAYGSGYEDPVFRDWLRMRADSVVDHLRMIKATVGDRPLMTCCSNAGPMVLNTIALNLEKIAPHLDWFMLENVGIGADMVHWMGMDAEAMFQKDVAAKKGNAPAITISYLIYEKGAYLGWALSRFWGVANWSSTLPGRLEEDPSDGKEVEELIGPYNIWEKEFSDIDPEDGQDLPELRLFTCSACRENGWRNSKGKEQWDLVQEWSGRLMAHHVGYRLLRSDELQNEEALLKGQGPLVLDGAACLSDKEWMALRSYLSKSGNAWIRLPFGTHDEKGRKRTEPLSDHLETRKHKGLVMLEPEEGLEDMISRGRFSPIFKQLSGDRNWAMRARRHGDRIYLHLLNTALIADPHPTLKDPWGAPILHNFHAEGKDGRLVFAVDEKRFGMVDGSIKSPEWAAAERTVPRTDGKMTLDLTNVQTYAVVQGRWTGK